MAHSNLRSIPVIFRSITTLATLALASIFLAGCAMQETASPGPVDMPAGIHGKLVGGQQPVSGASVYLVQLGNTGYGIPNSTSIIASTTTDANGAFTLPKYTCPSLFGQTMIEARGGNPGLAAGTNNSAIFLAALTGICGNLSASTFININEVTTVATAYTMRPFSIGNNIGVSATNSDGLTAAVATYRNLVNNATGQSPGAGIPAGMSVPVATINSLANSLAACVNTAAPTSTACSTLFSASGVSSSGLTANTFNIATAIASAPAANVSSVYNLATPTSPFQPVLPTAPNDWTLDVVYTSGNLNSPQTGLDIDVSGNVYVTTLAGFAGTVEILSNSGTLIATNLFNGAIDNPSGLAIDLTGAIVVSSAAAGDAGVLKGTSAGVVVFNNRDARFGPLTPPAADANGQIIVSDLNNQTIYGLYSDGSIQRVVPISDGLNGLLLPGKAAVNGNTTLVPTYGRLYSYNVGGGEFMDCGCDGTRIAFGRDPNGVVAYVTGIEPFHTRNEVFVVLSQGGLADLEYDIADNMVPDIAVDGLGTIWTGLTKGSSNRVSVYGSDFNGGENIIVGQPPTAVLVVNPQGLQWVPDIGIDNSGNVWLANGGSGGLVELVGAAAPVYTPIANAAQKGVATRP